MNNFAKLVCVICLAILFTTIGLRAGEIHEAVDAGDLDKIMALIEADPTLLESKDNHGNTPLNRACFNDRTWSRHTAAAKFLIDKGANVNTKNRSGTTPLIGAFCGTGADFDLIQHLVIKEADINARENSGLTPFLYAAWTGNPDIAKFLIDHGADINSRANGKTALHMAITLNSTDDLSKFLVKSGAKLNQKALYGNTELHLAAIQGFADLTRCLIEYGADVHAVNDNNRTDLYYAAKYGYRSVAEVLIAAGADKSDIEETNYGKAQQLTETLREGEAYLWYLGGGIVPGTGYAVKTKNNLLIFDPFLFSDSPDACLAQGNLNPRELAGQKITVLLTRKELHPFMPTVESLVKHFPKAEFIISDEENMGTIDEENKPAYRLAAAHKSFSFGNLKIHTIQTQPSTLSSKGNLGYLVEVDGVKVFHAGLLRSNGRDSQNYRREIDFLKPFGPIDFAILPAGWHHLGNIDYKQNLYLIDQLSPKAVYYIGDDQVKEEHRRAVDALNERDVPVFYPDGGITLGQRFHYLAPKDAQEFTDLYGDYLGQTPPGDIPMVFAPGIVSTDEIEHSAPAFSPDGNEVFWSISPHPGPHVIMTTHRDNGSWSAPTVASFSGQSFDSGPVFPVDGRRIYFMSVRPRPGEPGKAEIWFVEKQGDHWGKPTRVGIVERYPELQFAATPTIAANCTLYFQAVTGICRTELVHGEYAKPQVLPRSINLPESLNWTPFIAPDESYLIFSSDRRGQFGNGDLYISFHDISADIWSEPVNMGKPINTSEQERFPGLSPDGKYFFFTRGADIFWVNAKIIDRLREKSNERNLP